MSSPPKLMDLDPEIWYRYVDVTYAPYSSDPENLARGPSTIQVELRVYRVRRHTPKGVWLDTGFGTERFVLRAARKRFACPTRQEAIVSFLARKKREWSIYTARAEHAKRALELGKALVDNDRT